MTVNEYIAKLKGSAKTFDKALLTYLSATLALKANSLIQNRIIQTGVDSKGSKFSPYSTKPTFAGTKSFGLKGKTYWNALYNKTKGKNPQFSWRTIKGKHVIMIPGGYRQIRMLSGHQVAHKSFHYDAIMWRETRVRMAKLAPFGAEAVIGPVTERSHKIMGYHNEREKTQLLSLSKDEKQELTTMFKTWLEVEAKKLFG